MHGVRINMHKRWQDEHGDNFFLDVEPHLTDVHDVLVQCPALRVFVTYNEDVPEEDCYAHHIVYLKVTDRKTHEVYYEWDNGDVEGMWPVVARAIQEVIWWME